MGNQFPRGRFRYGLFDWSLTLAPSTTQLTLFLARSEPPLSAFLWLWPRFLFHWGLALTWLAEDGLMQACITPATETGVSTREELAMTFVQFLRQSVSRMDRAVRIIDMRHGKYSPHGTEVIFRHAKWLRKGIHAAYRRRSRSPRSTAE